ncbi:MAG: hypothetical protein HOA17_02045 [Candidatus Melainabacteria bacterium]|jgi:hypothetical protein|nr:hypothetical protein [Candidatus Melainabacteria bacterium]
MHDNKLNQILEQRAVEPASPDLATRIIANIETEEGLSTCYYRIFDLFVELV